MAIFCSTVNREMAEDVQDHWNRLRISQIFAVQCQNPSSYLGVGQKKEKES